MTRKQISSGLWLALSACLLFFVSLAGSHQLLSQSQTPASQTPASQEHGDGDGDGVGQRSSRHPSRGKEALGRWRKAPAASTEELSEEQRQMMEKLRSIGYAAGTMAVERSGVTRHHRRAAWAGLNLYSSGHGPEAELMDMDGKRLHSWRKTFQEVWPEAGKDRRKLGSKWWRRVHLYDNGDLLAIFGGLGIIKLDKSSNLIWARKNNAHHDLEVMPGGDVYVLTREPKVIPWVHEVEPTLEDFLSILDAGGNEKRRISILEAFRKSPYKDYVFQGVTRTGDVLHTNTAHVLDGRIAGEIPAFRKGNVLMSMNALGVVAVLDPDRGELVWALKSPPHGQHDPLMLDNGNLLLFDNRRDVGRSIVVEMSPVDQSPVWEYRGSAEDPFYSRTCGTAQRLPNGNTLITESDGGRALEVTAGKQVVWEYYTPHRAGDDGEYIATVAEMRRLPPDFPTDWLP